MAEIQLNRQAAANGQLPNLCLCCGAPAMQTVQHRFYLRSTGILIAMLLLGKMRWLFLPQSYEYAELRVPLCGFHRHRLNLHWYLLVGFAVLGLLCVPVLLLGSINRDYLWVTEIGLVAFLLLFPVMFFTVLTVMILTPRMVEHSNMSVKLVSVSNGFAQALGSAGMPGMMPGLQPAAGYGMPAKLPGLSPLPTASGGGMFDGFNLQLGLITAAACLLSLLEFGVIYFGNSLLAGSVNRLGPGNTRPVLVSNAPGWREAERRQREWEQQVRRQMEESQRRMEELNRRSQTQPYTPPSSITPSQPTPSNDPDHWDNVRQWKTDTGIELARGRLVSREGDWITVAYKRGTSSTLRERRLLMRTLSAADQAFVRSQFPDPPSSSTPQLTGETRPGGKLSPTNSNNQQFVPAANRPKPGFEVTDVSQVKVGDKVHIYWSSTWYPGSVLEIQQGLIKVAYDNHSNDWDELASLQRVRLMNPVAPPSSQPPAIPPITPTPPAVTPAPSPAPQTPPAEMRTWTDATGRFTLEAKLIGREGMDVKLERADGKIVTMQLDQLSAPDQVVVRAMYP